MSSLSGSAGGFTIIYVYGGYMVFDAAVSFSIWSTESFNKFEPGADIVMNKFQGRVNTLV